jgi:hypothetical protein
MGTNPIEPVDILAILAGGIIKSNLSWIPPHLNMYLNAHEKSFIEKFTRLP